MREKLTLTLYLLFVDLIATYLVVFPVYAFQVSSSTTGYVRVASQAAMSTMLAAQRSATLASVAPLISGASAGSVAVRLVAGSVGWPALGIVAGMTLAMVYYDQTKVAAIKAAAAPQTYSIAGYMLPSGGSIDQCASCGPFGAAAWRVTAPPTPAVGACSVGVSTATLTSPGTGFTGWGSAGGNCVTTHPVSGAGQPTANPVVPATAAQVQTYIGGLPANDSKSVESNSTAVGAQVIPQSATSSASNPVPDTGLATTVVPATSVLPTDTVINPNATQPTGTPTTKTQTQPTTGTTTTTTTTTTNPDGSVTTAATKTESETAVTSCTAGNHEERTFGSILQSHIDLWQGSGLLSALNLLKTLTWPTTPPAYNLTSSMFGSYSIDFSPWNGIFVAIRSIIIALAGFVAYRIVFVGSK